MYLDLPIYQCTGLPMVGFVVGMGCILMYQYTNVPVYQWLDLSLGWDDTLFYRFVDGSIKIGIPHFETPVATQNFAS